MNLNDLVQFIRSQGCKVTIYKNKKKIDNAIGLFYEEPSPRIVLATKGRSKKLVVSTLLHEFGHFCQWRDGFSGYFDAVCWPHNIHEDWVSRKIELTDLEKKMVRATMLSVEYDAEIRAIRWGDELKPKHWDKDYHLREAQSYIAAIKWSFIHRKDWVKRPGAKKYPAKIMTHEKLFAPLTKSEKRILKKIKAKR